MSSKKDFTHELPPFIIKMIKTKRKMLRQYLLIPQLADITILNAYNSNIQALIREYKNHKWVQVCQDINKKHGKSFWQDIKKLSKYKHNLSSTSILVHNNILSVTDQAYRTGDDPSFDNVHKQSIEDWFFNFSFLRDNVNILEVSLHEFYECLSLAKTRHLVLT